MALRKFALETVQGKARIHICVMKIQAIENQSKTNTQEKTEKEKVEIYGKMSEKVVFLISLIPIFLFLLCSIQSFEPSKLVWIRKSNLDSDIFSLILIS